MKLNKKIKLISFLSLFLFLLTGCNNTSSTNKDFIIQNNNDTALNSALSDMSLGFSGDISYSSESNTEYTDSYDNSLEMDNKTFIDNAEQNNNSKIITQGTINIETLEYEKAISEIQLLVQNLGGYTSLSNIDGTSISADENSYHERCAQFEFRIPKNKFESFFTNANSIGMVINSSTDSKDVSNEYFDIEARIKTLKIQEDRVLDLLTKATTIKEIIELETRLSELRYEIENLTTTLKQIDNLVDYSTVKVSISEVVKYEKINSLKPSFIEKVKLEFESSWETFKTLSESLILLLIASMPYLIFICIIVIIALCITKYITKKINNKKHLFSKSVEPGDYIETFNNNTSQVEEKNIITNELDESKDKPTKLD